MTWNDNDHPRDQRNGQWVDKQTTMGDDDLPANNLPAGIIRMPATPYDRSMRALADHTVTVTPNGPRLPDGTSLDLQALRDHPNGRQIARRILTSTLDGMPARERRKVAKAAFLAATPRDRRNAIDGSDLVRYFPADKVAASLQRRRDPDRAAMILDRIHGLDKNASANIIRNGFPNSKHTAYLFINRHKEQDQGVGTAARWYLRVKFGSPNGAPTETQARNLKTRMAGLRRDPAAQASLLWTVAYGNGHEPWPTGNGYAATRLAWSHALTPEGVQAFLDMDAGDGRKAKSQYHPDQRRLTAMRATLHALYPQTNTQPAGK